MYYEVALESRKWTQTISDTTETFVYETYDEDLEMDDSYGEFFAPNDDVGLAKFIYQVFPTVRTFTTPYGDIDLFLNQIDAAQRTEDGWVITLTYGTPEPENQQLVGQYVQLGFNTNGDSIHVTRSIAVRNQVARLDMNPEQDPEFPIPETYRLIGATKDTVEGIDISDAGLNFSITGYYTSDIWSTSVLLTFTALTKTYNNALFYGLPAGEVLLDQVEAQGEIIRVTPVTFSFKHSPNQNAVADLPFPALTALGHDYIDYRYLPKVSEQSLVSWPAFRYVHQIRNPGNFNLLGI